MAVPLSNAKQRVLEHLKRADGATAGEVSDALGITEAAVRQHLDALAEQGLVQHRAEPRARGGRGRSPLEWEVAPAAAARFADRHGQLTVELLDAIRDALGPDGLERVIETRGEQQLEAYRAHMPSAADASLVRRVRALARQRSKEGYMADVHRDGDAVVLVEHHCPICTAATACRGLCRSELEVFQAALGPDVVVERTAYLLDGDTRCAYAIRPASAPAGAR